MCDVRFLFLQQFSLHKVGVADDQLTGKHAAFFNADCSRCDIAFERAFFLNRYGLGNDLSRHSSLNFDAFRLEPAKAMNVSFALDDDTPRTDSARNLACEVNRGGIVTMQIAAESALDQSRLANYTAAAQIAFGRQMHVAARSNRSAKTAGDFVVAQIDVRAA